MNECMLLTDYAISQIVNDIEAYRFEPAVTLSQDTDTIPDNVNVQYCCIKCKKEEILSIEEFRSHIYTEKLEYPFLLFTSYCPPCKETHLKTIYYNKCMKTIKENKKTIHHLMQESSGDKIMVNIEIGKKRGLMYNSWTLPRSMEQVCMSERSLKILLFFQTNIQPYFRYLSGYPELTIFQVFKNETDSYIDYDEKKYKYNEEKMYRFPEDFTSHFKDIVFKDMHTLMQIAYPYMNKPVQHMDVLLDYLHYQEGSGILYDTIWTLQKKLPDDMMRHICTFIHYKIKNVST